MFTIFLQKQRFWYNLVLFRLGIFQEVFKISVSLWNHPAGYCCPPKTTFPKLLDMFFFQKMSLRRKSDFGVTYLERYLIKVVRMDHTPPFGFRKIWDLMCKFPSESHFLRKTQLFSLLGKWIDFVRVGFSNDPFSGPLSRPHFWPLKKFNNFLRHPKRRWVCQLDSRRREVFFSARHGWRRHTHHCHKAHWGILVLN